MPKFSICLIAKNEENTLPRLLASLKEFKDRNGEVILLDTGSTDKTAQVAREWGCKVEEVGDKFLRVVDEKMADAINKKFSVDEGWIVKAGDKNFDFASARNYCASLASNNMISMPDCDEIFTKLDIDAVDKYIDDGYEQLEFNFVFAHGPNGEETIKFVQCKFYNKKKMKWRGIIHEILEGEAKRTLMPENIFKIEHYQNEATDRKGYLVGLAIDCFEHPNKDRNSHYFARELMYRGFYNSAIKEFKRHIEMGGWDAERSQSLIYIGDCLMKKCKEKEALDYYHRAYLEFSGKREPLLKLGRYFFDKKDWARAVFYLEGALRIQYSGFYSDDLNHYGDYPYGMLYSACWWLGDKVKAKEYFDRALLLNPNNETYIREASFFYDNFEYKDRGIDGWMTAVELEFLYQKSKEMRNVVEIGSWKGRSTHALLSGCKGFVHAVDHFKGSNDDKDATKEIGKREDIFAQFNKNVGEFKNLITHRMSSEEAEKLLKGEMFDMIFIDGEHTYEGVKKDIELWKPHANKLLCGHDYQLGWPGVMKAVDEILGKPDGVAGSIWWKIIKPISETKNVAKASCDIVERIYNENVEINNEELISDNNEFIDIFTNKLKDGINFSFIKRGDGEEACMSGVSGKNCDGSIYYSDLSKKLKDAFQFFSEEASFVEPNKYLRKDIFVPMFEEQKYYNTFLHRIDNNLEKVSNFFRLLSKNNRTKYYIGPQRLGIVASILNAKHIVVPEIDGFTQYDEIKDKILRRITTNGIYIFSCGMMAKPLIAECLKKNWDITCLDIGSSFDRIVSETRTFQVDQKTMFNLYEKEIPFMSIVIPTLGRPEGLKRCLDSIEKLNYPKSRLEVITIEDEPRLGVAKRLNQGFREAKPDGWLVYGSNDIEFTPDSILNALAYSKTHYLIAFNTGELLSDNGNICEHFMISKDMARGELGGQIFDEDFNHIGVDNLLWAKMNKLGMAVRADNAVVHHYHFSKGGKMDSIYELGWGKVEEDRELLKNKLKNI